MSENSRERYAVTDRSAKLYIELLGKEFVENIKDANILEIGPGMTEKFARYLRKKGARVYTLAPSYRSDSQSGHLAAISHFSNRLQKRLSIKRIAGFAQEPSAVGVNFKKNCCFIQCTALPQSKRCRAYVQELRRNAG